MPPGVFPETYGWWLGVAFYQVPEVVVLAESGHQFGECPADRKIWEYYADLLMAWKDDDGGVVRFPWEGDGPQTYLVTAQTHESARTDIHRYVHIYVCHWYRGVRQRRTPSPAAPRKFAPNDVDTPGH